MEVILPPKISVFVSICAVAVGVQFNPLCVRDGNNLSAGCLIAAIFLSPLCPLMFRISSNRRHEATFPYHSGGSSSYRYKIFNFDSRSELTSLIQYNKFRIKGPAPRNQGLNTNLCNFCWYFNNLIRI